MTSTGQDHADAYWPTSTEQSASGRDTGFDARRTAVCATPLELDGEQSTRYRAESSLDGTPSQTTALHIESAQEVLQNVLDPSSHATVTEFSPEPLRWPTSPLRKRVLKARSKLSGVQKLPHPDREALALHLHGLSSSLSALALVLDDSDKDRDRDSSESQPTAAAFDRFVADRRAFGTHVQSAEHHTHRLSKLNSRLEKLESEGLRSFGGQFDLGWDVDAAQPPILMESLHPDQQEYYEKRGATRLLQDSLINHDAFRPRAPLKESSTGPASSEALDDQTTVSRRNWEIEHEEKLRTVRISEIELKQLWDKCAAAGLDVGPLDDELLVTPKSIEEQDPTDTKENEGPDHHANQIRISDWVDDAIYSTYDMVEDLDDGETAPNGKPMRSLQSAHVVHPWVQPVLHQTYRKFRDATDSAKPRDSTAANDDDNSSKGGADAHSGTETPNEDPSDPLRFALDTFHHLRDATAPEGLSSAIKSFEASVSRWAGFSAHGT